MTIERGAALLMPTPLPGNNSLKHLFVALTDSLSITGYTASSVLLVNVSSVYEGRDVDASCILQSGDHSRVTRPSYVVYGRARIDPAGAILEDVENGRAELLEPVSLQVLDRICAGLEASPNTRERMLAFYREAERLRLTS